MYFCPLCANALIIQADDNNHMFVCKTCSYSHPLKNIYSNKKYYKKEEKLDIVEAGIQLKQLPVVEVICLKCNHKKAYYQSRQTRSADQASTIFYTCVKCGYKWKQD